MFSFCVISCDRVIVLSCYRVFVVSCYRVIVLSCYRVVALFEREITVDLLLITRSATV